MRILVRVVAGLVALTVLSVPTSASTTTPASASAPPPHVTACSRGLVALTFDDGPSATVTPRLVRTLVRLDVPATFFMVGSRIAAAPDVARLVDRLGFAIGNHTWAHTDLTTQSPGEMREALRSTAHELRSLGIRPTPLMRPPYGAINPVVRRVVTRGGYVPVMWTIDSRDWTGLRPAAIAAGVLDGVTRHATNIVLQHDGVTNSPATVRALPGEVAALRKRGFCFASLDEHGRPTPPVPTATTTHLSRRVVEGHRAEITVRLDQPTSRPTSLRVVTRDVSSSGGDYGWRSKKVRFGVGERVARLSLPIRRDGLDEAREKLKVELSQGRGVLAPPIGSGVLTIVDRDGPPEVRIVGSTVTESATTEVIAPAVLRLAHASGRVVRVRLRTRQGSAGTDDFRPVNRWVTVPAGGRTAELPVTILPGPVGEPVETFGVEVIDVRLAHLTGDPVATVTIRPATAPAAPARRPVPSGFWP